MDGILCKVAKKKRFLENNFEMLKYKKLNLQHNNRYIGRQKIILIVIISLIGLCLRLAFLGDNTVGSP